MPSYSKHFITHNTFASSLLECSYDANVANKWRKYIASSLAWLRYGSILPLVQTYFCYIYETELVTALVMGHWFILHWKQQEQLSILNKSTFTPHSQSGV